MRNAHVAIVVSAFMAPGCNGGDRYLPVVPSTVPAPPTTRSGDPRLSPFSQRDRQPDGGTVIAVGRIVSSRVTPEDPTCGTKYPFHCQYFRVPVSQDGVLEVTLRWSAAQRDPYPLDMDVIGPSGDGWVGEIANGPYRVARGRITGGSTYVIEVWSFVTPHEPFELTTSVQSQ